ncbi:heavy-metal-associated domain-containing protein [Pannus brasiliensis CCIBt3594]|uniref:Heavy-metal-associated domain-containing protein n=1 Tax=Pannus brasiliensis CCIBt3594 TaxID=1427578 RepID=A0AAW9QNZ5_9CHRO
MTITLKVPSIACEACANTVTKAITGRQPSAKVSVDVATKTVTVETDSSREAIEQAIVSAGHTVES